MLVPPEHPCQQPNGITVAGLRRRAQEGFQVLGDDLMEHGVLGVAGPVDRSLEGHGPQVGSRRRPGQC
jgi:hypothetical protein